MCVRDQVKPSAPQLFEGMQDEDSDDYDEDTRFNIRPQFEGEAGHKVKKTKFILFVCASVPHIWLYRGRCFRWRETLDRCPLMPFVCLFVCSPADGAAVSLQDG